MTGRTSQGSEVDQLVREAQRLGYTETSTRLLERAVEIADRRRDKRLAFWLRHQLVRYATFSSHPEIALVAFSWCLGQTKRDPRQFSLTQRFGDRTADCLLWQFKWVARIARFTQFSRDKIEEVAAALEAAYLEQGASPRSALKIRLQNAVVMNDNHLVRRLQQQWWSAPRDEWSDCKACDWAYYAECFGQIGEHENSLRSFQQLIESGASCVQTPAGDFGTHLIRAVRCGKSEKAWRWHRMGLQLQGDRNVFATSRAGHLAFLGLMGKAQEAIGLLERSVDWGVRSGSPRTRLLCHYGFRSLTQRLMNARLGQTPIRSGLLPCDHERRVTDISSVHTFFEDDVTELGSAFDARNGNQGEALRRQKWEAFADCSVDSDELPKFSVPEF